MCASASKILIVFTMLSICPHNVIHIICCIFLYIYIIMNMRVNSFSNNKEVYKSIGVLEVLLKLKGENIQRQRK